MRISSYSGEEPPGQPRGVEPGRHPDAQVDERRLHPLELAGPPGPLAAALLGFHRPLDG